MVIIQIITAQRMFHLFVTSVIRKLIGGLSNHDHKKKKSHVIKRKKRLH